MACPEEKSIMNYFLILLRNLIFASHLKVVDRLERVDAGHETVLEAEQSRLEILAGVPGILANQQEVWLQEAETKENVLML